MNSCSVNKNKSSLRKSVLFILTVFLVFSLASCANSTVNETAASTTYSNTVSETTTAEKQTIDSNIEPLDSADALITTEGYGSKGALADTDLSLADMLLYAVQDEYLAHGEYLAIIEKFGSETPYTNIVKSEESHLAALETLYSAYGMAFPEDTSAEHLIIPESLLEAAQTGVQAEIDNIAMYERFLTYELPDRVRDVFESLKTASESHLAAFQKQVDRLSK